MTELEKLLNHEYYNSRSEELRVYCEKVKDLFFEYNKIPTSQREAREQIIRQAFGSVGENPWVESPFQCDIGITTHVGDNLYVNHNCIFLDGGGLTIGNNVWIGGGVTIIGGVTIGDNTIIGAGSVVTHDIPANVIAVGNPCHVLREISEEDKKQHGPFRDKA